MLLSRQDRNPFSQNNCFTPISKISPSLHAESDTEISGWCQKEETNFPTFFFADCITYVQKLKNFQKNKHQERQFLVNEAFGDNVFGKTILGYI